MVAAHRCRSRTNAPASHSEANRCAAADAAAWSASDAAASTSLGPDGVALMIGTDDPLSPPPAGNGDGDAAGVAADPLLPEPDRPGEHDAADCRLCARPDADYLWTDVDWRLLSWRRQGLLSLILESRARGSRRP
jgi:hypothetical protein